VDVMKVKFWQIILITVVLFGVFFAVTKFLKITNSYEEKIEKSVEYQLSQLSLEEKIGQMLIISDRTNIMTDELAFKLEKYQPGGFILFSENFSNYEKTKFFLEELQKKVKIPLFLSIDQEGGTVQRLTALKEEKVTFIPTMRELGNTKDESLSYNVGMVIAKELQVFGINMNFAPVLDIVPDGQKSFLETRSFGSNANTVSKMGLSLGKGMLDYGVIPVYKHFPGHGSSKTDSHYDLPIINKSKQELYDMDLIPFIDAIKNNTQVIMIGHLAVPSITNNYEPASVSKEMITDFLKKELNYQGLVITDALNMKAITNHYSEEELYQKAVMAGVDILLMPNNIEKAIQSIKEGVETGQISEEQINESVRKILILKSKQSSFETLDKSILGNHEHQSIISKIME